MIVAMGVPNATEITLLLEHLVSYATLLHAFGSNGTHDTTANDGDINVLPWHCLHLLGSYHLDVYMAPVPGAELFSAVSIDECQLQEL